MMINVIDTNVLLVANKQHEDISEECIIECIQRLLSIKGSGAVVIDDDFRILSEYQNKTEANGGNGAGDAFLKWLLQNKANAVRVSQVSLTETAVDHYFEFPDQTLQPSFDPPDRKFAAVANTHPNNPPVLQAADCKWLNWWQALHAAGVSVEFICPGDVRRFYQNKFPKKKVPPLP